MELRPGTVEFISGTVTFGAVTLGVERPSYVEPGEEVLWTQESRSWVNMCVCSSRDAIDIYRLQLLIFPGAPGGGIG